MDPQLIILFCHSVWGYGPPALDSSWPYLILPMQAKHGWLFEAHMRRFVELLQAYPQAVGIVSGGETRAGCIWSTEAYSYVRMAEYCQWWGAPEVATRVTTENFADDTLTNIVFSLARYQEFTGQAIDNLACLGMGFAFKTERTLYCGELINRVCGLNISLAAHGVNNPLCLDKAAASEGRLLAEYQASPFDPEMNAKRATRNPGRRRHGYLREGSPLMPIFAALEGDCQQLPPDLQPKSWKPAAPASRGKKPRRGA